MNRPRISGGFRLWEKEAIERENQESRVTPEFRERALRLVSEHEKDHPSRWVAFVVIASKLGSTAETLLRWVSKAEPGDECENSELEQANEILRKASTFFGQAELDRPFRK